MTREDVSLLLNRADFVTKIILWLRHSVSYSPAYTDKS